MSNSLATSFLLFVEEFLVEEGFAVIPSSEEYNLLTLSQMDTLNRNTHTHALNRNAHMWQIPTSVRTQRTTDDSIVLEM